MPKNTHGLTGGQVVAGSNPVSPTQVRGGFRVSRWSEFDRLTYSLTQKVFGSPRPANNSPKFARLIWNLC